jgi:hypothetical protein
VGRTEEPFFFHKAQGSSKGRQTWSSLSDSGDGRELAQDSTHISQSVSSLLTTLGASDPASDLYTRPYPSVKGP